jgi:hypothetical protein
MTRMAVMMSGGAIGFKSKFQLVIVHSYKEAEFISACDTGKMILFFRSLLADIGVEQVHATVFLRTTDLS